MAPIMAMYMNTACSIGGLESRDCCPDEAGQNSTGG